MALPKINHPTYSVTIPSLKKEVTLRPFTVQEEKILFMARSSDNTIDVIKAIKQVIGNCIFEPVDLDKLATFDIEYLFIKLRAKSVGEVVELEHRDQDELIKFSINLDEIEVKYTPGHSNKILVTDKIGLVMRYPTLEEISTVEEGNNEEQAVLNVLLKCIDKVFDEDKVYSDFTHEEILEFVDNLPLDSMNKIKEFFDTMPVVEKVVTLKNKKGDTKEIALRGLSSFFTS